MSRLPGRPADARMRAQGEGFVPVRIDLSALVRRSVATFYSHLVTRPTGQALRLGIESQLEELGSLCVSVLDFSEVVVLDVSCADEAVAKLLQRFQREDRPADAYFIARGLAEAHRDTLETVLGRHGLALAADVEGEGRRLLGSVSEREREAWMLLERTGRGEPERLAERMGASQADTRAALDALAGRRVIVRREPPPLYYALTYLLENTT